MMTRREGLVVWMALTLSVATATGCLWTREDSVFKDGVSGRPLPADMTLSARIALNMERLSGGKYLPERIFDRDDWGWPGDTEGRVLLALVLEGQALRRTPPTMECLFKDLVAHFNAEGYMGPVCTETVSEQQLMGNGWILRAFCEYARSTTEPVIDAKALANRLAENLHLKALGKYRDYPIDPKARAVGEGSAVGSKSQVVGGWELSTDIGAAFAALDGVTDVYALTKNEKLKPLIEEIAARFAECDPVVLRAQTHSTLTTLRALLRYDAKRFLPLVEKRFAQYREFGMTDRAENYNWFCRYDTWTEPCAIVDSFIVAETLWRETGKCEYRELAERILTALVDHQRDNGGFGLRKTFPRGTKAPVIDHTYEAHWCCTMRGGAGLAWAKLHGFADRIPFREMKMDRSKLLIGAYRLQPELQDEWHIREMAECGIDYLVPKYVRPEAMDVFWKCGVGVMLGEDMVPWRSAADGEEKNGNLHKQVPVAEYERVFREKFYRHPAAWGYKTGDELSALDFPHFGAALRRLKEIAPDAFQYYNCFPSYALPSGTKASRTKSQLGTETYAEHVAAYFRYLPLDYLCFDCYCYAWGVQPADLLENLRIVSDACIGQGKSPWVLLQANVYRDKSRDRGAMTLGRLRYQANAALAYGAEMISWTCWGEGWFEDNVLDEKGEKTPVYWLLKTVNGELKRVGKPYMRYRRVSTDLVGGFKPEEKSRVGSVVVPTSDFGRVSGLAAEDGSALLVGHFCSRAGDDAEAVYVVSADEMDGQRENQHVVRFKTAAKSVTAVSGSAPVGLTAHGDGVYSFEIESNRGVLVEVR